MSALFTFEQIKKALANTSMPLVCVIVITLLTTSCATVPTKQTTSTDTTANSLTTKEKSDNETTEVLQKIECRKVVETGTHFKRTICEFKETWADISKEDRRESDEFVREITKQSGIINPEGKTDSGMGKVNSPNTPGGF
jgi:major membrane immunogen (membrane-anchored lipoprotein)